MENWDIVEFSLENFSLSELLEWRLLFDNRNITSQYLYWQYFCSPFGPIKTWLAIDHGQIIGQYSLQPFECFINGEKAWGSLCLDVATHPDHQNRGIFTQLGTYALNEDGKNGIVFSIGFPNPAAIPGHKKVGWIFPGKRVIYAIGNPELYKVSRHTKYIINVISNFSEEFDKLIEFHKKDLPIMLIRNSKYLNYRYFQKFDYHYYCCEITDRNQELAGYFILKEYQNENEHKMHIIDFQLPDDEICFFQVLDYVCELAQKVQVPYVNVMLSEKLPFCKFLIEQGFVRESYDLQFIAHRNNYDIAEKDLLDINNYYLTFGDTDIY